uniref:Jasmonate O-methyltransferase n=1 Tax=Leersia perrieri TaxID=77586 RepID=A0A0D9WPQ6_9ORYZ
MAFKQSPHMNPGEGEASYARNSAVQKTVQESMKTLIEEAVTGLFTTRNSYLVKNMVIADLGCSSGPNALTLVSAAIDAIHHHCVQQAKLPPKISVFLNDLPNTDFNTVAKSLATLKHSHEDFSYPIVITGIIPGSFYERLFACGSLHLVCSSNSIQWLSKAPDYLKESKTPMYDSDESLRLSRRQTVRDAYAQQFREDFTLFLNLRAQEMVSRGRMVVSLYVRCSDKPDFEFTQPWIPVMVALSDMALRDMINKEKFDSFHLPLYCPLDHEVNKIIEDEGSFEINRTLMHDPYGVMDKALINPRMMALWTRAAFEPLIVQHFGSSKEFMDEFMRTLELHLTSWGMEAVLSSEYPLAFMCLSLIRATY